MFGKSLNVTDIAVLAYLVLWSAMWGISGAARLRCAHAYHPRAARAMLNPRRANALNEQPTGKRLCHTEARTVAVEIDWCWCRC